MQVLFLIKLLYNDYKLECCINITHKKNILFVLTPIYICIWFVYKQMKGKTMTKYTSKIQYVSWNEHIEGSCKKADTKKIKLENQGYNLISTQSGLFTGLLVYENSNYKNKGKYNND
jgi:hypothetical protein